MIFVFFNCWWFTQGDNLVTAMVTGPGIVFIQSLPFPRLSQRIARTVTSPNNPKFFMQIVIFCFFAYFVLVSSLLFTDM
ncbi:putative tryptophan RNA-binding attenuator protein-like domain superfamily [Helianthus anomalus]